MGDSEEPEHHLKRDLSALDLTVFGVGVINGTGTFLLTGLAAKELIGWDLALELALGGSRGSPSAEQWSGHGLGADSPHGGVSQL